MAMFKWLKNRPARVRRLLNGLSAEDFGKQCLAAAKLLELVDSPESNSAIEKVLGPDHREKLKAYHWVAAGDSDRLHELGSKANDILLRALESPCDIECRDAAARALSESCTDNDFDRVMRLVKSQTEPVVRVHDGELHVRYRTKLYNPGFYLVKVLRKLKNPKAKQVLEELLKLPLDQGVAIGSADLMESIMPGGGDAYLRGFGMEVTEHEQARAVANRLYVDHCEDYKAEVKGALAELV